MTILAAHEPKVAQATLDLCTQNALGTGCPMRARATVTAKVQPGCPEDPRRQCGMHAVISVQADANNTVEWDDPADEPFAVSVAALYHAGLDVALAEACDTRPRAERVAATMTGLAEHLPALGFAPNGGPYLDGTRFWTRGHLWVSIEFAEYEHGEATELPGGQIRVQLNEQVPVLEIPADLPWSLAKVVAVVTEMTPLRQYQDTLAALADHTAECQLCPDLLEHGGCCQYQRIAEILVSTRKAFDASLPIAPAARRGDR